MHFKPLFLFGIFSTLTFQTFTFAINDEELNAGSNNKGKRTAQDEKKSTKKKHRTNLPLSPSLIATSPRPNFSSLTHSQDLPLNYLSELASSLLMNDDLHNEKKESGDTQILPPLRSLALFPYETIAPQVPFIPAAAEITSIATSSLSNPVRIEETLYICISSTLNEYLDEDRVKNYLFVLNETIQKIIKSKEEIKKIVNLQNNVRDLILTHSSRMVDSLRNLSLLKKTYSSNPWCDEDSEIVLKELKTMLSDVIDSKTLEILLNKIRKDLWKSKLLSYPIIPFEEKSTTSTHEDDFNQPETANMNLTSKESQKKESKKRDEHSIYSDGMTRIHNLELLKRYMRLMKRQNNNIFKNKVNILEFKNIHLNSPSYSKNNKIIIEFFKIADLSEIDSIKLNFITMEDDTVVAIGNALKNAPKLTTIRISVTNSNPRLALVVAEALPYLKNLESLCLCNTQANSDIIKNFLEPLKNLTHLRILYLTKVDIDKALAKEIKDIVFRLPSMKHLQF